MSLTKLNSKSSNDLIAPLAVSLVLHGVVMALIILWNDNPVQKGIHSKNEDIKMAVRIAAPHDVMSNRLPEYITDDFIREYYHHPLTQNGTAFLKGYHSGNQINKEVDNLFHDRKPATFSSARNRKGGGLAFDTPLGSKTRSAVEAHVDMVNWICGYRLLDTVATRRRWISSNEGFQQFRKHFIALMEKNEERYRFKKMTGLMFPWRTREEKVIYYLRRLQHNCDVAGNAEGAQRAGLLLYSIPENYEAYRDWVSFNWRVLNDWHYDPE